MDDIIKHTPGKIRNPNNGAQRAYHCHVSNYISIPCRVLLVPIDGYFSGGASIRANRQSQVIGWRDLFYENSIPRKIIVPLKKKENQILSRKASIIYNGSISDVLNDSGQRKLKLLVEKIRELLKTEELEQRKISKNMAWTLKKEFNESYLEMALQSKSPVLYSNLELKLPLL